MSSTFDRRLSAIRRTEGQGALIATDDPVASGSTIAWRAAERITRLPGVDPDTTVTVTVDGLSGDVTSLEVTWNADGVASIRQVPAPTA